MEGWLGVVGRVVPPFTVPVGRVVIIANIVSANAIEHEAARDVKILGEIHRE